MQPTRQTLIERIQNSNSNECWESFFEAYGGYIFIIIRNMGISFHDSQELEQEVMLRAWKALPNFDYDPEKGKFRWWLCKIVKNTVNTYLLKEKQRQARYDLLKIEKDSNSLGSEIDKIAEKEWKKFVVSKAWNKIQSEFSPETLQAFQEINNGKKVKEVALELGVAENTIHVYKSRVQKRLYREIAKIDYELNC